MSLIGKQQNIDEPSVFIESSTLPINGRLLFPKELGTHLMGYFHGYLKAVGEGQITLTLDHPGPEKGELRIEPRGEGNPTFYGDVLRASKFAAWAAKAIYTDKLTTVSMILDRKQFGNIDYLIGKHVHVTFHTANASVASIGTEPPTGRIVTTEQVNQALASTDIVMARVYRDVWIVAAVLIIPVFCYLVPIVGMNGKFGPGVALFTNLLLGAILLGSYWNVRGNRTVNLNLNSVSIPWPRWIGKRDHTLSFESIQNHRTRYKFRLKGAVYFGFFAFLAAGLYHSGERNMRDTSSAAVKEENYHEVDGPISMEEAARLSDLRDQGKIKLRLGWGKMIQESPAEKEEGLRSLRENREQILSNLKQTGRAMLRYYSIRKDSMITEQITSLFYSTCAFAKANEGWKPIEDFQNELREAAGDLSCLNGPTR